MPDSGIDWDYYDHGPGSEEHKHRMAVESREYHEKAERERQERIEELEAKIDKMQAIIAELEAAAVVAAQQLRDQEYIVHRAEFIIQHSLPRCSCKTPP